MNKLLNTLFLYMLGMVIINTMLTFIEAANQLHSQGRINSAYVVIELMIFWTGYIVTKSLKQ